MMKTYSICVNGDVYQVSHHPDVYNFLIVRHQSGEHRMIKLPGGRWRCINDNPFCSYIPIHDIDCLVKEKLSTSATEQEETLVGMDPLAPQLKKNPPAWLNKLRSFF